MMEITILLLTLAALTFAQDTFSDIPTVAASHPQPTSTTSSHFRLVVDVTSHDVELSVQDWAVSSYHIGPCYSYAVLLPKIESSPDYSRAFYVNGTESDVQLETNDIITDGGTPRVPYALVVPAAKHADKDGRRPVQMNCGYGTSGVTVLRRTDTTPHLRYVNKATHEPFGGWYACNTSLIYGPAVVLYYRETEEPTPKGCVDIKLCTECVQHDPAIDKNAQVAACVANVINVDRKGEVIDEK